MKTLLIAATAALFAFGAAKSQAQVVEQTTTTTQVTSADGTINTFVPGTTFVMKEQAGPVTYSYGPEVTYVTRGGVVLTPEQVRNRVRAGLPVRVEYMPQGETRVIQRVVIQDEDADDDDN